MSTTNNRQDVLVMISIAHTMNCHTHIVSESRFLDLMFYEDDNTFPTLPPCFKKSVKGYVSFLREMNAGHPDTLQETLTRFNEIIPDQRPDIVYSMVPASFFTPGQLEAARAFVVERPDLPPSCLKSAAPERPLAFREPWIL